MSDGEEKVGFALIDLGKNLRLYVGESLLKLQEIEDLLSSPGVVTYTRPDGTSYIIGQATSGQSDRRHPGIAHKTAQAGTTNVLQPIRLYENARYKWQVLVHDGHKLRPARPDEASAEAILTSMSRHESWDPHPEDAEGTFESKNYLGVAWIGLTGGPKARFEFISRKLDYETQYLALLNYLTIKEVSLLYDFKSPTATQLAEDRTKRSAHKLDSFLLLRAILPPRTLRGIVNQIISRPHSALQTELSWKPASYADPSHALAHPSGRVRWAADANGARIPEELLEAKRHDSFDTTPNRFAKYALEWFLAICEATNGLSGDNAGALKDESRAMTESIRMLLGSTFFRRVGRLTYIPFDNQVLQKREGYRQLLKAFLYSNCGVRLPDLDEGGLLSVTAENRNVPKLSEIWLFFFLAETLEKMGGSEGLSPYKEEIRRNKDRPTVDISKSPECKLEKKVTLEGGPTYCLRLFYNRSFTAGTPGGTGTSSILNKRTHSYSMELQPDYTIEATAPDGQVTFIHFDAKFRIKSARISNVKTADATGPQQDGVAQPDDVHKMHTYNDAIYGTAASVILYPGEIGKDGFDQYYRKFEELLPGVGALEIKPGNAEDINASKEALESFIRSCLREIPPGKGIYSRIQAASAPASSSSMGPLQSTESGN